MKKREMLALGLGALALGHNAGFLHRRFSGQDTGAVRPRDLTTWNYTSPAAPATYVPATTSQSEAHVVAAAQAQHLVNPADFKRHLAAALVADRHYVSGHGAMTERDSTFRLKDGQYLLMPSTAYPAR